MNDGWLTLLIMESFLLLLLAAFWVVNRRRDSIRSKRLYNFAFFEQRGEVSQGSHFTDMSSSNVDQPLMGPRTNDQKSFYQ